MVFPKQNFTINDPGIGATAPVADAPILSGIAHGGSVAVNTLASIGSMADVRSLLGFGPLAEDVALALSKRGGPVLALVHNSAQSVTLTNAALNKNGGTGPTIVVSGLPNDLYNLRVEILAGGALGVSTFRFSLDAFDAVYVPFTQSATRATVTSYVIANSGLTLTFPAGTYVLGDVYTLTCVPQVPGTTDLATVAGVLEATPAQDFHQWLVSGAQPDATTGAAIAAALQGHLVTLTQSFRFARAYIDIGSDDTKANVKTAAATWTGSRVCPGFGYELRASLLPFEGFSVRRVPCASGIAVRAFGELISSDLSRTAAGADDGVSKIEFDGFYDQTLDALQISTMRTWPGKPGFYIAGGKLKCSFGSDYTDTQFGRVMDVACSTTYAAQFPYQSATFRTIGPDLAGPGRPAGAIDERDAHSLERVVTNSLEDNLLRPRNASGTPGHVSALSYTVDLSVNLATTQQLKTTVALRPLGYAKDIETTLFFTLSI